MRHIYTMAKNITSPLKGTKLPFAETWMALETVIESKERENQISLINAYMWNLEKWYRRN